MTTGTRIHHRSTNWTHPSVTGLGAVDVLGFIQNRAREQVVSARAQGWGGPPFNPFELAEIVGIPTVPRDDLRDARLISDAGMLKIEYNPNRPTQRVRFSVAHELAHALFPDAGNEDRHRVLIKDRRGDEWQLELLCNVAAAELLMPSDAFPDLADAPLDIEQLLQLRNTYDVSTEALILRVVDITEEPAAAVATARVGDGDRPRFRLDYVAESQFDIPFRAGDVIESGVLGRCTAVGFTNTGIEVWGDVGVHVQAVGIPAYPGDVFPRVAAILRPVDRTEGRISRITQLRGDALQPVGEGRRIVAQLVNDATTIWGGRSFAAQVAHKWPSAQAAFRAWANELGLRIGSVHLARVEKDLWIASLVAQRGFGPASKPRVRYEALSAALYELGRFAEELEASIHMPPIGTGLAGGDWKRIEELIDSEVCSRGVAVTVYRPLDAALDTRDDSDPQLKLL